MKNRNIILGLVVVILAGGLFYWYSQNNSKNESVNKKEAASEKLEKTVAPKSDTIEEAVTKTEETGPAVTNEVGDGIVYYYGAECPHCKDVLAYFDENDIYNKVKFTKKEVWHNKANGEELRNAALKCGMNPSNIGVPFVFSQGKCFMGGPDVMDFFAKEAGIEK